MAEPAVPSPSSVPLVDGGFFTNATVQFYICMALAIGIVFLFCRKKFDERTNTASDDYIYQLAPSQLATKQEYMRGFLIYFIGSAIVVAALSLIGAKNAAALGIPLPQSMSDAVLPLGIALILVGVVPNLPVFQELEKWGRQYAHEIAYIPRSALATAERLSAAGFDFSLYSGSDALQSEEMRGVDPEDFKKSRRSLEYAWARLGCLIYAENSILTSDGASSFDTAFLQAYQKDLDAIQTSKKALEQEVAAYRAEKARNPGYSNEALNRAIRNDLYKLYVLLGCAVRIKQQPHNDINLPLQRLGFQLEPGEAERNNNDLILVGIVACAVVVVLIQFPAVLLGSFNLWDTSILYPSNYLAVFYNTGWTLIPFGTAIVVADFMRKRAIRNGRWFNSSGRAKDGNFANYIRVAAVCGVVGYLMLMLWDSLAAEPTKTAFQLEIPNALLAMVTGGFYVWHLDMVELGKRWPRLRAILMQAFVTAICGVVATTTSWSIRLPQLAALGVDNVSDLADLIALMTVMSAAVGGLLGWYVPAAAASAKVDPLSEVMDERVQKLEMAAAARFGDVTAATRWMDQPQPVLEQKSPRQAAHDVEGFERAMALLQGPRAVAA